jgi:uncharacterized membrane protein
MATTKARWLANFEKLVKVKLIQNIPETLVVVYDNAVKVRDLETFNLLKPTGYVMHQQFNIQEFYALPTLYLWDLYLSQNKQRLLPHTT